MNTVFRQLSIALLAASASVAFAAPDTTAEQRVEIAAPRPAALAAQVVLSRRDLDSDYAMSTGRRLIVSSFGDGLQMRYGRQRPTILHHDGKGSFVSSDGRLSLEFELDRTGEPNAVRLQMPSTWL
ncbi:MAG: hypothetical protein IPP87_15955 [Ideonella sp.]|nr:hypothetical protein [Ideonella sp.]MBL0150111.1 hypothetical protein [Ideonella sp.]